MYGAPPVAGRSGSKLKWIIISVVLVIMIVIVLFVVGILFIISGAIKSSDPYQHAVQVATHDSRVVERLGAPIKPGWLPAGSINVSGGSGQADLSISVEGSKAKGTIYVVAKKTEGEWVYQNLALRVEGSEKRIDLLRPSGSTPSER
jgi:hypothetical protein